MELTFARHETFHIRSGWLRKGLKALESNNHIFLVTVKAMVELGFGKNMINSLRYWLVATGLTKEKFDGNYKIQVFTPLAKLIMKYDPYIEDLATIWLIHFHLASNKNSATTWYWFFNYFNYTEFDKDIFINELIIFIKRIGEEPPAISSLENDFNVLRKMYTYQINDKIKLTKKNYNPEEDLMESPFIELKILTEIDNNKLKINRPTPENLSPPILYYCLLLTLENKFSIDVDDLLSKENSIGRIFKLNSNTLYQFLDKFQELGYIRLDRHAGHNSIKIIQSSKEEVISSYYEK